MARKVTIAGKQTIAHGFIISEDGTFNEVSVTLNGTKSDNACGLALRKEFGLDTLFSHSEVVDGESVDLEFDVFASYSRPCIDNVSYGHDTVVREVGVTLVNFATVQDGKPIRNSIVYPGITTNAKLRKYLCDYLETKNVAIIGKPIPTKYRRYVTKELFMILANGERPTRDETSKYFARYAEIEAAALEGMNKDA